MGPENFGPSRKRYLPGTVEHRLKQVIEEWADYPEEAQEVLADLQRLTNRLRELERELKEARKLDIVCDWCGKNHYPPKNSGITGVEILCVKHGEKLQEERDRLRAENEEWFGNENRMGLKDRLDGALNVSQDGSTMEVLEYILNGAPITELNRDCVMEVLSRFKAARSAFREALRRAGEGGP